MFENLQSFMSEAATHLGRRQEVASFTTSGMTYCPGCCKERKKNVWQLTSNGVAATIAGKRNYGSAGAPPIKDLRASLFQVECVHCSMKFSLVVYLGPEGNSLACFPNKSGGLSTPNTPESVAHFVDQAFRANSVGAVAAAISMYRVAADQLLHECGYNSGMLDAKVKALADDIENGKAPEWAQDLSTEWIGVLKKLGNVAAHPKDVKALEALNNDVMIGVQLTMMHLLDIIYEEPARELKRKEDLKKVRDVLI